MQWLIRIIANKLSLPIPHKKWRDGGWYNFHGLEFWKRIDHIGRGNIKGIDNLQTDATV